jgi:hypothetical protein
MKLFYTLLVFVVCVVRGFAQGNSFTVFFQVDKYNVSAYYQSQLKRTIDSMGSSFIDSVSISAHTDSRASNLYNEALSERRAWSVQKVLFDLGIPKEKISIHYLGEVSPVESNESSTGRKQNRRAIAIFYLSQNRDLVLKNKDIDLNSFKLIDSVKSKNIKETLIVKQEKITEPTEVDTLLTLPKGIQIVADRDEYLRIKDCIDFVTLTTPNEVLNNNLTTNNDTNYPLISGGMAEIRRRPSKQLKCVGIDSCFKKPFIIRFPINCTNENMRFFRFNSYRLNSKNQWVLDTAAVNIVKINNTMYYETKIYCMNTAMNFDKKPDCAIRTIQKGLFKAQDVEVCPKIKLKLKNKMKFVNVVLTLNCPLQVASFKATGDRSQITLAKGLVCKPYNIQATVLNENNDTLIMKSRPLASLERNFFSKSCLIEKYSLHPLLFIFKAHGKPKQRLKKQK